VFLGVPGGESDTSAVQTGLAALADEYRCICFVLNCVAAGGRRNTKWIKKRLESFSQNSVG